MKLTQKKAAGPHVIADLSGLEGLDPKLLKDKIVLAGELVLTSLNGGKAGAGWVDFAPRPLQKRLLVQKPGGPALSVALDKKVVTELVKHRAKPILLVDALLRYGQKLGQDDQVLYSLCKGQQHYFLLVLAFKKRELAAVQEIVIPRRTATADQDLHVQLEQQRNRYAGATHHWCGPLDPPPGISFKIPPALTWASAPPQALSLSGKASLVAQHGLSVLLILAAGAGSAAAVYLPYQDYAQARASLAQESQALQGEYAFASDKLALLRARQAYFTSHEREVPRLAKFEKVLTVTASVPELRLHEARLLTGSAGSGRGQTGLNADFELVLEVPKQEDATALGQSKVLLESLSQELGMNLRLATSEAHREIAATADKPAIRRYRVQGDFS